MPPGGDGLYFFSTYLLSTIDGPGYNGLSGDFNIVYTTKDHDVRCCRITWNNTDTLEISTSSCSCVRNLVAGNGFPFLIFVKHLSILGGRWLAAMLAICTGVMCKRYPTQKREGVQFYCYKTTLTPWAQGAETLIISPLPLTLEPLAHDHHLPFLFSLK